MGKRIQKKEIIREILFFLLKFNLLLIPFYAVIYFDVNFYSFQEWFAGFIGFMLKMLGYSPDVSGIFIYVKDLAVDISRDCVGWKSIYSLFALVLASPGILKNKLKFLIKWVPALFLFNIFRVLTAIIIGLKLGGHYLELFHNIIWQEAVILMIVGVWYLWMKKDIRFQTPNKLNKKKQ